MTKHIYNFTFKIASSETDFVYVPKSKFICLIFYLDIDLVFVLFYPNIN